MFVFGISYAVASLSCTIGAVHRRRWPPRSPGQSVASGVATFIAYGLGMALLLMVLTVSLALARQGVLVAAAPGAPVLHPGGRGDHGDRRRLPRLVRRLRDPADPAGRAGRHPWPRRSRHALVERCGELARQLRPARGRARPRPGGRPPWSSSPSCAAPGTPDRDQHRPTIRPTTRSPHAARSELRVDLAHPCTRSTRSSRGWAAGQGERRVMVQPARVRRYSKRSCMRLGRPCQNSIRSMPTR